MIAAAPSHPTKKDPSLCDLYKLIESSGDLSRLVSVPLLMSYLLELEFNALGLILGLLELLRRVEGLTFIE